MNRSLQQVRTALRLCTAAVAGDASACPACPLQLPWRLRASAAAAAPGLPAEVGAGVAPGGGAGLGLQQHFHSGHAPSTQHTSRSRSRSSCGSSSSSSCGSAGRGGGGGGGANSFASSSTGSCTLPHRYGFASRSASTSASAAPVITEAPPADSPSTTGASARVGFGAKVAVPRADVLHEALLQRPARIKMRAYHIGARIHIGKVLQAAEAGGVRTIGGKDYALVWVDAAAASDAPSPPLALLACLYRYGSVVMVGATRRRDPSAMAALLPPSVLYTPGRDEVAMPARPACFEDLILLIDPSLPTWAAKGDDCLRLRSLDVGSARVASSVVAQSVALQHYQASVDWSLQRFEQWKAVTRPRALNPFQRSHDQALFKVMAASSLTIIEAQGMLDAGDAGWAYDVHHQVWALLSDEFELDARLAALKVKLQQIEDEAHFDISTRHERRYSKLERYVVWLLWVSLALALLEVALEAGLRVTADAGAGAAEAGAAGAAAAADRADERGGHLTCNGAAV